MRSSLMLLAAAAAFDLASGNPMATCTTDACARSVRATDCSSFFSYTVVPSGPTVTTTVYPTATATVVGTTVTNLISVVSATHWPTTINSEDYTRMNGRKRDAAAATGACSAASTVKPSLVPAYAASACATNSARYSSACACAGYTPRYTTQACVTAHTAVTASPRTTVTQVATATVNQVTYITVSATTALVDDIRCGAIIPIDEDLPAYKIVCEAQGTGNRTLLDTMIGTDWDNCVERATWQLGAYDWEFDLDKQNCYIYDKYPSGSNHNVTVHKSRWVYAYIY